jgi:ribosomal 30S subunit maturation factor RimM
MFCPELDALALEEEEEDTSYLADLNKVPDFVDEPPVEVGEVSNIQETLKRWANTNVILQSPAPHQAVKTTW